MKEKLGDDFSVTIQTALAKLKQQFTEEPILIEDVKSYLENETKENLATIGVTERLKKFCLEVIGELEEKKGNMFCMCSTYAIVIHYTTLHYTTLLHT